MLSEKDREMIDLLVEQEARLEELYRAFGGRFPKSGSFWEEMAAEERLHGSWLGKLRQAAEAEVVAFDSGKIRRAAVHTFLGFIGQCLEEARGQRVNELRSFHLARDLEAALLEQRVFEHFSGDSAKFRSVSDRVRGATEIHRERLERELARREAEMPE